MEAWRYSETIVSLYKTTKRHALEKIISIATRVLNWVPQDSDQQLVAETRH
jgi:uncharacterized phage-associated protein